MLKRAFLYLKRNTVRTLILFIVMFILGIFISGSVIIRESAENVRQRFLKKAGASMTLSYWLEDDISYLYYWNSEHRDHEGTFNEYYEAIQEIINDNYVTDHTYSLYKLGISNCLYNRKDILKNGFDGLEDHNILLFGVDMPEFIDLQTNDVSITTGRSFTREEINNGAALCIVNENLRIYDDNGEYHEVKIGDVITAENVVYETDDKGLYAINEEKVLERKQQQLEVIGIFHVSTELEKNTIYPTVMLNRNKIYVPNNLILSIQQQYDEMESQYDFYRSEAYGSSATTSMGLTNIVIQAKDTSSLWFLSSNINDRLQYLNHSEYNQLPGSSPPANINVDKVFFSIIRSTDAYQNISWVLKSLDAFANVILYVSVTAFVIILSLIIYLFLKTRKTEIGILMSLGTRKSTIIAQIVLELLLIGILAFSSSTAIGTFIAEPISRHMMNETMLTEYNSHQTDDDGNIINKVAGMDEQDVMEMYEIKVSRPEILKILRIETGVILVSSAVTVFYTTRFKPKEVLLG